jgi:predicted lipoprotein with Yx(FWY)xxD motif
MKKISLRMLTLLIITVSTYVGCKKSDSQSPYLVKLATSTTLGQYLVDKDGYTLYFFSNDYNGRTSCSGGCETLWPYFSPGTLTADNVGTGLSLADFDTINVSGKIQVRYKGWPLYYYAPSVNGVNVQEAAGTTSGEAFGNVWFVAKPDYSIMLANAQLVGNDGKAYTSTYTVGTGTTLYFTDPKGLTLYKFSKDSFNINKFTKADFSNNATWPIYDTTVIVVPSILDKTLFANITVAGYHQLVYKGWPLYYYGLDAKVRGSNKGVCTSTTATPGTWPVAVKDLVTAPKKQ